MIIDIIQVVFIVSTAKKLITRGYRGYKPKPIGCTG